MKVILLFCFAWTLVASREHDKVHHKLKGKHHDDESAETETKWHRFGVDLSKINIEPGNCKNNIIMPCNTLKLFGYCSHMFYAMLTHCPLACRFCAAPQRKKIARKCEDKNWQCPAWAHRGDCLRFPEYMRENCKKSCMLCGEDSDDKLQFDADTLCPTWGSVGYCQINKDVRKRCRHSCHVYKGKKPEQGINPDYENAFYYLPFYINLPYTSLKKPVPTIAPTEHPPSEKPLLIPTLPPNYSTLPPTHAFTTPEAGEGLPTIEPGNETEETSPEPSPEESNPEEPPQKTPPTEAPSEEATPQPEPEEEPPQPEQAPPQPEQEPPQPEQAPSQQEPSQPEPAPPQPEQAPSQPEPEPPQPVQAPPQQPQQPQDPAIQPVGAQASIPGQFPHAKHHHKHHHKRHHKRHHKHRRQHFIKKLKRHHKSHAKPKHHAKSHKKHTDTKIKKALRKLKHKIHYH